MSANGSFADRVARQLGVDRAALAGIGRSGPATLHDVLRHAGRAAPAAARPASSRALDGAEDEGRGTPGKRCRWETVCEAGPIRRTCEALAALSPEPPATLCLVVRLCGAALRDFPTLRQSRSPAGTDEEDLPDPAGLLAAGPDRTVDLPDAGAAGVDAIRRAMHPDRPGGQEPADRDRPAPALVVRTPDARRPPVVLQGAPPAAADAAVLTVREVGETVVLVLECGAGGAFSETGEAFLATLRTLCLDPRRALL